ncbi:DNA adenine methylase [Buttiauxella sp. 3AFRM03]|uniref:DNA adenine methylase n=1 Tax=Buttiauxella sp. 3AFRM03 TaxID=2479367 RepID=UPI000EF7FBF6|nr:DNA adenine methylase [Buttiauxella sp. 3AFRM03]AYN26558.1 DNA adenine methylase [Buttiauxella sp. 3AFRM03]
MNTPLKWVGSKTRIMEILKQHLPAGRRLVEPFAGSCAVLLHTDYEEYLIGDVNPHLINFYQQVKDNPEELIGLTAPWFTFQDLESYYYSLREFLNTNLLPPLKQAAIFLFLNRHCYGGVCRYNLKGEFNTPYGHYKKTYFPENEIRELSRRLARATLICGDFSTTLGYAHRGDVVYCDPPYIPASPTADFTGYHTDKFGAEQHRRLVTALVDLSESRIPVVLSNSDTPVTRELLRGKFKIQTLSAPRSIGNRKKAASTADEIIAVRNLSVWRSVVEVNAKFANGEPF